MTAHVRKKATAEVTPQDVQAPLQEYLRRLERQHLCPCSANRLHEAGVRHALAAAHGSAGAMASEQGFIEALLAEQPSMSEADPMRLLGWHKVAAAAIGFVEGVATGRHLPPPLPTPSNPEETQ